MKIRHYIAMDLHSSHTVLEAQTPRGRVVTRRDFDTGARTLIEAVKGFRGPRGVVIEEGVTVTKDECNRPNTTLGHDLGGHSHPHVEAGDLLPIVRSVPFRLTPQTGRQTREGTFENHNAGFADFARRAIKIAVCLRQALSTSMVPIRCAAILMISSARPANQ